MEKYETIYSYKITLWQQHRWVEMDQSTMPIFLATQETEGGNRKFEAYLSNLARPFVSKGD